MAHGALDSLPAKRTQTRRSSFNPKLFSWEWGARPPRACRDAKRRGKLASHAVAGNPTAAPRPERAVEAMNLSVVLSGQSCTILPYQPPCGWLISSGRLATRERFLKSTEAAALPKVELPFHGLIARQSLRAGRLEPSGAHGVTHRSTAKSLARKRAGCIVSANPFLNCWTMPNPELISSKPYFDL